MKISRREKKLLLITAFMLIIFGGVKLVIIPSLSELEQVKAANSQINQFVQIAMKDDRHENDSHSVVNEELDNYLQLEEQLPHDKQFVTLVDQIGKIATENNVTLLSIDYTEGQNKINHEQGVSPIEGRPEQSELAGVVSLDFNLNVTGSYYHLLGFLQDLERSQRLIMVKSTKISVGQKEEMRAAMSDPTLTSASSSYSYPPSAIPNERGSNMQTVIVPSETIKSPIGESNTLKMAKYDLGKIMMSLQITTFYDTNSQIIFP